MQSVPPSRFAPGATPSPFCAPALDGPVLTVFAGDAVVLPLTWWQVSPVFQIDASGAPVRGSDGNPVIVTPGVPVDMTGLVPSAEFLTFGQVPGQGIPLSVTSFVPAQGRFTVTAPGRGQAGDLTSGLPASSARNGGPRVRVHYADAAGNPHTFGTFYLTVK